MAVLTPSRARPKAPSRQPSPEARQVLQGFAAGAELEIKSGLVQGVAFATMIDGAVAWVHPDGTVRAARAADSAILQG